MINKQQLRAARAWLGISQNELAKISKVAPQTIKNFERSVTVPYERTLRDIQKALEKLGVEFVFSGGEGVGVRKRRAGLDQSAS
jgi:transcriptional regulator with XRE-family HTH domain